MLKFSNNSCYTDTLFTILFKSLSSFWRDKILTKVYNPSDFNKLICKSQIKSPSEVSIYSNKIKNELIYIYAKLIKGDDITCSTIRPIFNECLGDLFVNGYWVTYSPDIIYGLLTDLYPDIKINNIYQYLNTIQEQKISYFTMWEFMENQQTSKKIRWDLIDTEILVFQNPGVPAITIYNQKGEETNVINYDNVKVLSKIYKENSFSEFILNDNYLLIGVITLQGYLLGQEGGTHYIGYYRNKEGKWVYYDDTKPSENIIDKLPETGVWKYLNYNIPYMYFYQRTDKIKNDILKEIKSKNLLDTNSINQIPSIMNNTQFKIPDMPNIMNTPPRTQFQTPIIPNIMNTPRTQFQAPIIPNIMNTPPRTQFQAPNTPIAQFQAPIMPNITNVPLRAQFQAPIMPNIMNTPIAQFQDPNITNVPTISQFQDSNIINTIPIKQFQDPVITNNPLEPTTNVVKMSTIYNNETQEGNDIFKDVSIVQNMIPDTLNMNINPIFNIFNNDSFMPSVLTNFNLTETDNLENIETYSIAKNNTSDEDLPTRKLERLQNNILIKNSNKNIIPGLILLPQNSTIVKQEPEKIFSIRPYESLSYKHDIGHNRAEILAKIDIKRLLKGKKSSKNNGYKLDELTVFAKALGIKVNQSKDELVDAIRALKEL